MATLSLVAGAVLMATNMQAAAYCSLIVTVHNAAGEGVSVRIAVEETNGWRVAESASQGSAKLCGLGIKPVTVIVGDAACNQVTVRNVPLQWNTTQTLPVTYDETPCRSDTPPVAACAFVLRFIDTSHQPIGTLSFATTKPFPQTYRADDYGRVMVRIAAGQEMLGEGSASGYKPVQVSIRCTSENMSVERVLQLARISP
jgi:hypothetical protein